MANDTIVRVGDIFNAASPGPKISDGGIKAKCPSCGEVNLASCKVTAKGDTTTYLHERCGNVLAIVSPSEKTPWEGRGWAFGKYMVRNPVDLIVSNVLIPAAPNALAISR